MSVVSYDEVRGSYEAGMRIACASEGIYFQYLAIAKRIVSQRLRRPVRELKAARLHNGNIIVKVESKETKK